MVIVVVVVVVVWCGVVWCGVVCVCVCVCVCVYVSLPLYALHMSRIHRLSISLENIQGICSSSYAHDVTR